MRITSMTHVVQLLPQPRTMIQTNAQTKKEEIRVCTNRTCRKQGSLNTIQLLKELVPPNVDVNTCGCLGRCGNGPNIAILPAGHLFSHCSTPAHVAHLVLNAFGCGDGDDVDKCLECLDLRMKAQVEFDRGEFSTAELLLSQAVDLKPWGGIHMIYKNRSRTRFAMGNYAGALEDAREALALSPHDTEAYMCQGDALMAMEKYDAAERSYTICLDIDPSIRRSKSFKDRVARLQEKLVSADTPAG